MTELETLSEKRIKMNIKCFYCKKELMLGERIVHGECDPFHLDCAIKELKKILFDDPEPCCCGVRQRDAFEKIDKIFGEKKCK